MSKKTKKPLDVVRVPRAVKVGGFTLPIYKSDSDKFDSAYYGEYDHVEGHITLNGEDKIPLQRVQETLLHECIHAVDDAVGIGLKESQVRQLGRNIYALLRDNKDLAEFLLA